MVERIALITDFGGGGPYLGQMRLLLAERLPGVPVVEAVSDLPPFEPRLSAYLIPALLAGMPARTLYLCVVDPGVGGTRRVLWVRTDNEWLLAPDNGLLAPLVSRSESASVHSVGWRPEQLSDTFHGRDLFLPLAVRLISGESIDPLELDRARMTGADWPEDLASVLYVDRFGNLVTGLRAEALPRTASVRAAGREVNYARTFCEAPVGAAFWYRNAFGLVELAVNQGRADEFFGLGPGADVTVLVHGQAV